MAGGSFFAILIIGFSAARRQLNRRPPWLRTQWRRPELYSGSNFPRFADGWKISRRVSRDKYQFYGRINLRWKIINGWDNPESISRYSKIISKCTTIFLMTFLDVMNENLAEIHMRLFKNMNHRETFCEISERLLLLTFYFLRSRMKWMYKKKWWEQTEKGGRRMNWKREKGWKLGKKSRLKRSQKGGGWMRLNESEDSDRCNSKESPGPGKMQNGPYLHPNHCPVRKLKR